MPIPIAADYTTEQTELIRSATLTVATILGDYLGDMVIVGGLVPTLLVSPTELPAGVEEHVGTMDLDLGLDLAILDQQRYAGISTRLLEAGFSPDVNEKGNNSRQRWQFDNLPAVKIDFLMPRVNEGAEPGRLQNLDIDLAAFIIPGLELAFNNNLSITISGTTLLGETATRSVPVCNPGVFVMLKALAFKNRGKAKDAYDLHYIIRNFGDGPVEVATYFQPIIDTELGREAIEILRADFIEETAIGPMRTALFRYGEVNDELQADVVGDVSLLLREIM